MRVLVLGGDGYLGFPTALYFKSRGHDVEVVDSLYKRGWESKVGVSPLVDIGTYEKRFSCVDIKAHNRDIFLIAPILKDFKPEVIVHYAEQPSAPFSMIGEEEASETQTNNIVGTLVLLFAIRKHCPDTHLIKLGTMGEYGTPNIDIEEGFINIIHKGRMGRLPFPKQPGSFYHASKVADSVNIEFACKTWGLRSTDLNQGVVYGIETPETKERGMPTSFHYDSIFGTVLNRFCVQAVADIPLTVYGKGTQKRSFLNINDTLQCVELAANSPPRRGEYRVFNQFTEVFSINDLAEMVRVCGEKLLGRRVLVEKSDNPRTEAVDHYYNPVNASLVSLGLKPVTLSESILNGMLSYVCDNSEKINVKTIQPTVRWVL